MLHTRHPHSSILHFCTGLPSPIPEDSGDWGLISGSSCLPRIPEFTGWIKATVGPPGWFTQSLLIRADSPLLAISPTPCSYSYRSIAPPWPTASSPPHSVLAVSSLGTVPMRHWPYSPPNSLLSILGFQPKSKDTYLIYTSPQCVIIITWLIA